MSAVGCGEFGEFGVDEVKGGVEEVGDGLVGFIAQLGQEVLCAAVIIDISLGGKAKGTS